MADVSDAKVWVANKDLDGAWLPARVISREGDDVIAKTEDGTEHKIRADDLKFQNDLPDDGVEDMTKLNYLHEPALLNNLRKRFMAEHVYTYTGKICIAVNPFNWDVSNRLYTEEKLRTYSGREIGDLPPHLYAIAETAYQKIKGGKQAVGGGDQSILVSGESGAGKTESVKIMMQYLAVVSVSGRNEVTEQVLASNPLLEAFGNARTSRNNNSSRFGKFIELQFNTKCSMSGARIHVYLLEKTRVVWQAEGERNYHIFYQLLKGMSEEQRQVLKLKGVEDYTYTAMSKCTEIAGVDDAKHFQETSKAMSVIGVSDHDVLTTWKLVAAVVHMSNLFFEQDKDDAGYVTEGSMDVLKVVAELLTCDDKQLAEALCKRQVCARDDWFTVNLTKDQAGEGRDALCKTIYGRIFAWLVEVLNKTICNEEHQESFCGILDIFGFECFKVNLFEQLCINYANERLQQQFNWDIFKSEQAEYEREQIEWKYIKFSDNQACLDMIDKRPLGLIHILNEESSMQQGTDETFVKKLVDQYRKHEYFKVPRLARNSFTVKHYAGEVTYDANGFREKNKDSLHPDLTMLMQGSGNPSISTLFPEALFPSQQSQATPRSGGGRNRKGGGQQTVGSQFSSQLQSLMSTINSTGVNYVRCIKPNTQNKPAIFEEAHSAMQLRCAGVLEAIRISRLAYPNRLLHREFVRRYSVIADKSWQQQQAAIISRATESTLDTSAADTMKECCRELMGLVVEDDDRCQIGVTKVFFKAFMLEKLEERRADYVATMVVTLQKNVRALVCKRRYYFMRLSALRLQSNYRSYNAAKNFRSQRKAAIRLQAGSRGMVCRKQYRQIRAALRLQCASRCRAARLKVAVVRRNSRATSLQSYWRMRQAHTKFVAMRSSSVRIQSYVRMMAAWRSYKVALKEKQDEAKLTNQLQKLQLQLAQQIEQAKAAEEEKQRLKEQLQKGGYAAGGYAGGGDGSTTPRGTPIPLEQQQQKSGLMATASKWLFNQPEGGDSSLQDASSMLGKMTEQKEVMQKKLQAEIDGRKVAESLSQNLEKELNTLKSKYSLEVISRQKLQKKSKQMEEEMFELKKMIESQVVQISELTDVQEELNTKTSQYEDIFHELEARNLNNSLKMEECRKAKERAEEEMKMYKAMLQASHERGLKERQEIRRDAMGKIQKMSEELSIYKEEIHVCKQKLYEKEESLKKRMCLEEEMIQSKKMLKDAQMLYAELEQKTMEEIGVQRFKELEKKLQVVHSMPEEPEESAHTPTRSNSVLVRATARANSVLGINFGGVNGGK